MTTGTTDQTNPTELQRRIAISQDFDMMQGLINVGTGVGLLVSWAAGQPVWMAIISGVSVAIGTEYYKKKYGTWRAPVGRNLIAGALSVVAVIVICIAIGFDHWEPGPILYSPLVTAVLLAGGCWLGLKHVGLTPGHWLTFGLLALSSLLPIVGVRLGEWGGILPVGLALIAIGIIDHVRLVRGLGVGAAA